jgi:hypothetical protein
MNHSENSENSENYFRSDGRHCSLRAPIYLVSERSSAERIGEFSDHSKRSAQQARILARKRQFGDRVLTYAEIRKVLNNSRFTDLAGRRIGKLLVGTETFIRADSKGRTQRYWMCTCDCGMTKAIRANSLICGHSKSCSAVKHRQMRFLDLTSQRFGNVVALAYAGLGLDVNTNKHYRLWRCRCDCGKLFTTRAASLRSGLTRSCGHLRADKARARFRTLHFIERQMGKSALAGLERLSAMDHCQSILKNALGSLPVPPDKGRSV